jgi:hypothetical protein
VRDLRFAHVALVGLVLAACSIDTVPSPLRATPPGSGPTVVFDLLATPLPDIPTPNDIATYPDPTSRTGRRLNASLIAPTRLEQAAREQFDEMEGWGTFAPMTVRFTPEANTPAGQAALDLVDLQTRMIGDGFDPSNDPVYLVNLTTGVPVLLDAGGGDFPVTVLDPTLYFPNDPRLSAQNLMYETANEAVGPCADGIYRPRCDTDFDGVLDRPNTLGPGAIDGVDNLMTWYERQTDTLILQPMLPLQEKTEYAVVLTDRLRAPDGQPVRSPFAGINHPSQTASVARLQGVLGDPTRTNYFGDIAGTGFAHVAFAWTFTTQPVQEDLTLLRNGLYGQGPFASLSSQFPTSSIQAFNEVGTTVDPSDEPQGWRMSAQCANALKTPYIVHWADIKSAIEPAIPFLFPLSTDQLDAFIQGFDDYVDYLVIGTYDSPYLMGDPASPDPDLHFHVNFQTGQGDIRHTPIPWVAVIPKENGEHKQPFPVAYWRHGTTLFDLEIAVHAGIYARQGIAMVSMDIPGHGLVLSQGDQILLGALLKGVCFGPAATAMTTGRAIDLNGDGTPDSGGLIWSSHLLHTRDGMRQAVLDGFQLNRIFKSWGTAKSGQDYNGNGDKNDDLAGDFNGDGKVDFGGPNPNYSSSGGSLGGLVAEIHGALDPTFNAGTAPVSGGGGFIHVAVRSKLTPDPVMEEVIGPLIVAVPASSRPPTMAGAVTQCTGKQLSVRWVVGDLLDSAEVEIACLDPDELSSNMTVVVQNYSSLDVHCARTLPGGAFRVPVPSTIGDRIHIGIYAGADVIDSYATCNVQGSPALVRTIDTWEQAANVFTEEADPSDTCAAAGGSGDACQQYWTNFYPVGSQLVAPQEGLGYFRQSPDFRKLMNLAQAALDPADPVNFAKLYLLAPPPDWNGNPTGPRPILDVHTVGDYLVPTATGMTFSRAAGLLPFLPPSAADTLPEYADYATPAALYQAWGGRSPDRVMIDDHETEGLSRLERTPLPAGCGVNYVSPTTASCDMPPPDDATTCAQTLFDGDYLGESMQGIGQAHLLPPMRLARLADKRASGSAQLDAVWAPRIQGAPFSADGSWMAGPPVAGMINAYLEPLGDHDWGFGDVCQAWDGVSYMDELLAHYFATHGQDVYYLTHATTHECLATQSCAFLPSPP